MPDAIRALYVNPEAEELLAMAQRHGDYMEGLYGTRSPFKDTPLSDPEPFFVPRAIHEGLERLASAPRTRLDASRRVTPAPQDTQAGIAHNEAPLPSYDGGEHPVDRARRLALESRNLDGDAAHADARVADVSGIIRRKLASEDVTDEEVDKLARREPLSLDAGILRSRLNAMRSRKRSAAPRRRLFSEDADDDKKTDAPLPTYDGAEHPVDRARRLAFEDRNAHTDARVANVSGIIRRTLAAEDVTDDEVSQLADEEPLSLDAGILRDRLSAMRSKKRKRRRGAHTDAASPRCDGEHPVDKARRENLERMRRMHESR